MIRMLVLKMLMLMMMSIVHKQFGGSFQPLLLRRFISLHGLNAAHGLLKITLMIHILLGLVLLLLLLLLLFRRRRGQIISELNVVVLFLVLQFFNLLLLLLSELGAEGESLIFRILLLRDALLPLEWLHGGHRLVLVLHALLNGPQLGLFGAGRRAYLTGQLLVHHPLPGQPVLQLADPVVDLRHLVLPHGQLGPLLGYHVVLLLVQLPPVGQLPPQALQFHQLRRERGRRGRPPGPQVLQLVGQIVDPANCDAQLFLLLVEQPPDGLQVGQDVGVDLLRSSGNVLLLAAQRPQLAQFQLLGLDLLAQPPQPLVLGGHLPVLVVLLPQVLQALLFRHQNVLLRFDLLLLSLSHFLQLLHGQVCQR